MDFFRLEPLFCTCSVLPVCLISFVFSQKVLVYKYKDQCNVPVEEVIEMVILKFIYSSTTMVNVISHHHFIIIQNILAMEHMLLLDYMKIEHVVD